jgi:hypothetical protein
MYVGCWCESQKEKDHWKNQDGGGWVLLKWILAREDGVVWTELIWLRIRASGGLL